jgi:alpha-galactosidase
MAYKITIIGGGSSIFTPQLMQLFLASEALRGSTIVLMDIDPDRLAIMDRLCKLLVEHEGADLKIESTTDRRQSLVDTDFVITAISVGGFDAWEVDLEIPARYGIFMVVGDTTGPGGIMRGLRHIPPLIEVCKDLEEVSPKAWVFNYTNPATAICMAMQKETHVQAVSVCTCSHIPNNARHLAAWAGVDPDDLILPAPAGGINHCATLMDLRLKDGRDIYPLIKKNVKDTVVKWGIDHYGILPYCGGHWTEFIGPLSRLEEPYQGRVQGLRMSHDLRVHDMEDHRDRVRKWEQVVDELANGKVEFSTDVLPKSEFVIVVDVIESLIRRRNGIHVLNVPNRGAIENLPTDAIVEVSCVVGGYGIQPIHVGSLPEPVAAMMRKHISAQNLMVEAALSTDRDLVLKAFLQDPAIAAKLTPEETVDLLNELLIAHKEILPQFQE